MKKILTLTLAFLMMLSLTACGNGTSDTEKTGNSEDATGAASGTALELWTTTLGEEAEIVAQVTKEKWNAEHPDTPVNVTIVPGNSDDFYQKLSAAFATGKGPDIFTVSDSDILKYATSGIAYDVTSYIEPNKSDYVKEAVDAVTIDGKIIAFPGNMDIMGIYCNNALFKAAGLELPKTWDELINAANTLATKDRYGIICQTDVQSGYQLFEFYPFLWMCGGDVIDASGKVAFDSAATREALEFYSKLLNAEGTCKKVENSNTDITPFGTERTAMQICGSWAVSKLSSSYSDIDYSVIPYPTKDGKGGSGVIGGWQYMVSAKGSNPKAAADYLNWLLNSDTEIPAQMATREAKISPRNSVREAAKDYYSQYPFTVFIDQILPMARKEPCYDATVVKVAGDAIQDAVYSSASLDDIVSDAAKRMEKAIK